MSRFYDAYQRTNLALVIKCSLAGGDHGVQFATLYQYKGGPFCVKGRHAMKRQSLSIDTGEEKR